MSSSDPSVDGIDRDAFAFSNRRHCFSVDEQARLVNWHVFRLWPRMNAASAACAEASLKIAEINYFYGPAGASAFRPSDPTISLVKARLSLCDQNQPADLCSAAEEFIYRQLFAHQVSAMVWRLPANGIASNPAY